MSMMGELNFFLGLQIEQLTEGTFINQVKYIRDLLKRFNMVETKTMKPPMSSSIKLDMDEKGKSVNSTMYRGMIAFGGDFSLHCALQGWFSFISVRLGLRRWAPPRLRASVLLSHINLSKWRLVERRGMTRPSLVPSKTISDTSKSSPKGKSSQGEVSISPNFSTSGLRDSSDGWDGFRGVEIRLSLESICRILDIPSVGLRVYEAKAWPTVPGFESREAIQRLCGLADAQGMGKPSTHSLTVPSRVLHHMICSILLPRRGHRYEVSYLEAFIVDSILTGRRIHMGYLMMMHMISYVEGMI
ncbi:hypothetical protein CK203_085919 [Vitis vinifera]|uniref:Reverse transcriptase Ty1/copia-type domain-containing protein n=1 Tax=Vitis vinifera TaxID=29760 RepID=A0A438DIH4_VITVI|nr:hypothetical protein CK203_085919 [Vitis vinifera]